ncbi:MAG: hypothetical protein O3A84_12540, partial [Proteobacteria bacterium]|nr:hypothetical protein [Pseudomonadota bacterium]
MKAAKAYEAYIAPHRWQNAVIGYRSGLGNNIHMAKNAFNEIRKRNECVAIAIDISDFFGSIDHSILINNLKLVLGSNRLTNDWFSVIKSMTKYSWVESEELDKKLGLDKESRCRPLCQISEFRNLRAADKNFV